MAKSSGKAGSLFYGMTLDTKEFKKSLKDARKAMKSTGEAIREVIGGVSQSFIVTGGAIAAGTSAMMLFTKATAEANNEQILLANSIGATQAEIAGLEIATTRWGVENSMVIDKMREFGGIDEFEKLADDVKNAGDEQSQLNKAIEIFGGEGAKMLTVLQLGSDGLAAMEQEARDLGLALSPQQIEQNNVAWGRFEDTLLTIKGLSRQVGTSFLQAFHMMTGGVKTFVDTFGKDIKNAFSSLGDFMSNALENVFKLFAERGIPFMSAFIKMANSIGQAFQNVFNFITGGGSEAFSFIETAIDNITIFMLNFGNTLKAAILNSVRFAIEGVFKIIARFSDFIFMAVSEIAQVAEFLGALDEGTTDAILTTMSKVGTEIEGFGKMLAKPYADEFEKTTEEMGKVAEENRRKTQKFQSKFLEGITNFSEEWKKTAEVAKESATETGKTAKAVANLSTERAALAQTGTQEEFRIRQGAKQAEIATKQLNEQKKLRLAIERLGTA